MHNTISRSEYGTLSPLPEKHLSSVRREAQDVVQQMVAHVHRDPFLLAQYAAWHELNEQAGVEIGPNPEATFILSQYNGGYRSIESFIPITAKSRFVASVTGVIGEASTQPTRG